MHATKPEKFIHTSSYQMPSTNTTDIIPASLRVPILGGFPHHCELQRTSHSDRWLKDFGGLACSTRITSDDSTAYIHRKDGRWAWVKIPYSAGINEATTSHSTSLPSKPRDPLGQTLQWRKGRGIFRIISLSDNTEWPCAHFTTIDARICLHGAAPCVCLRHEASERDRYTSFEVLRFAPSLN